MQNFCTNFGHFASKITNSFSHQQALNAHGAAGAACTGAGPSGGGEDAGADGIEMDPEDITEAADLAIKKVNIKFRSMMQISLHGPVHFTIDIIIYKKFYGLI